MSSYDHKNPVYFVTSVLSPKFDGCKVFDFFVHLTAKLSIAFREIGYPLVLFVPSSQETASKDQENYLLTFEKTSDLQARCSGVIINPFDKEKIKNPLADLIKKFDNLPIMTIDQGFESEKDFKNNINVEAPPSMRCDEVQGGAFAAQCAIRLYRYWLDKQRLDVVIVSGLEGSKNRISGFKQEFKEEKSKNIYFDYHIHDALEINGRYDRATSKELFYDKIGDMIYNDIDIIFCCNDEMALGVRDAISDRYKEIMNIVIDLKKSGQQKAQQAREIELLRLANFRILGFDGIQEARTFINIPDQWLINSIDANIGGQVEGIISKFLAWEEGTQNSPELESIVGVSCVVNPDFQFSRCFYNVDELIK